MKKKIALITGVTGQDGSYLAEFLLSKKYIVHGIIRRSSSINTSRLDAIYQNQLREKKILIHYGDLNDQSSLTKLIYKIKPNEILILPRKATYRLVLIIQFTQQKLMQ